MDSTFITVATFTYSSEAKIIRGLLESEGIRTYLSDEHTIDTDPLVSNAIGGVKLNVARKDIDNATHILNSISEYSITDEGEKISCPNCMSSKIHLISHIQDFKSLVAFLFSGLLFGLLPFYTRYDYRCDECKIKFNTL
ncbi:DUF2007 domain-containing protein [Jejudonia soesokkakensis]|uniref:DUF2007 domain-containing protein n=1 Tax=Jejudonia soesokkakensis TaxID=1323432 RepID=A0ABW2MPU7_9FLAO